MKRYTVAQIVKESSNIVLGTVTVVNTKRRTADIKVEENLKGTSEFQVIKMRFDTWKGEADQRSEVLRLLQVGEPVIVCYRKDGGRIDSLAHTKGKWFQTAVTKQSESGWGRWMFTHIEKYLNRYEASKRDSTLTFQKELRAMLGEDRIQLFFLKTKSYLAEPPIISNINSSAKRWISYQETTDPDLPGLGKVDILWLGFRTLARNGKYRLNNTQEERIKTFVRNGGVVIVSGQDSDAERPCRTGWLPEPLDGVESPHRSDFQPTTDAGQLFQAPHRIRSGQLSLDDSWADSKGKYQIMATTNRGKEIVVAKLRYGKGMYLVTSLHNGQKAQASQNRRMLENLVHFAVEFLEESR